ncbi:1-deoxy-D-xylulose-5-phosphate reductoisomerase [Roseovarius indicus]|uniref:1-deoxy-D-xylulose 5-phosphate reductoisomerase n=1 Tax=Roseovarius indicus TaxID=540747 RepID=A0A0T5PB15_9RHOB|nr:1-deoxy-D-xylulose-5-phosphate reductoisomerase [Roseovarius indicus]KRS18309.1 1-deoxy-D-xylulose 5-phosphate reductoisomerase [Roseovarius indicus]QEW26849.1 1-deoxy-D-xylulose 5-phosphate reductoisomerase [Roseovarius indicus]SFD59050.1 1-deoxy-D-xylulose 5-phosphate reductoisomerase [Roseovarius indicus]
MKRISILGSTGSIGQNTIDLVRRDPAAFQVVALTGGQNIDQLARDAKELKAEVAVTADDARLDDLRTALKGTKIEAAAGAEALIEAAQRPAHWVMSAIVGSAGLRPGLAALEQGATLALANKESLVAAGPLVMKTARTNGARILPVDSEHSAIFQALRGEDSAAVTRIIITASGGAFRDWPLEDLERATPEQAATHPNWDMGQRITIDSASMFNKALEMIEAREFFGFAPNQIEVLIHPESLVHAMVAYCDGGIIAHVGPHDMRHAIGHAMYWPERYPLPVEQLNLAAVGQLNFHEPDLRRYPVLRLAREVMDERGFSGAIFNAAKERALDHFIAGHIGFCDMCDIVEEVLARLSSEDSLNSAGFTLETVLEADQLARARADDVVKERTR